MAVIPLTLTISLCLVFTFVVFFLREQARARFGSAESDALLPLAEETSRVVPAPSRPSAPSRAHDHDCGCRSGRRAPCAGCLRRTAAR